MKISIITPCRNSEKTIKRTIDSVLSQKTDDFELEYIIIDGKSTDGTLDILKGYKSNYCNFSYISEEDHSMTEALNKGMKMATGDIVASINADDVYLPDTLNKVCQQFSSNPKTDVLMTNTYIIRDGGYVKSHNTPRMFSPFVCALIECPFPECAVFFKRECVSEVGYFNENIKYTQDIELYLRQYYQGYRFQYANIDGSCFFVSEQNYSTVISGRMRDEVRTFIKYPTIYKYISGSSFSKLLKVIMGMRHYYILKKMTYESIIDSYER